MGTGYTESPTPRDTLFLKDGEGFFNFRPSDFIERSPIGKGKCVLAFADSRENFDSLPPGQSRRSVIRTKLLLGHYKAKPGRG